MGDRIVVEPGRNGATLRSRFNMGDSMESMVFRYEQDDLSGLADMLYEIADVAGPTSSRYDAQRIKISIVHGDKHECDVPGCEVCGDSGNSGLKSGKP